MEHDDYYRERQMITTPKMDLRDWFAGQALPEAYRRCELMVTRARENFDGDIAMVVAIASYRIADAMLAARKEVPRT